jgi:hypothetical protein
MSDSLVLASTGELLPADPNAVGCHLLISYDLGDPQAITSQVASILLDGERVTSSRAGNRTIVLPVLVRGSDRLDLSARVDALLRDVQASDGYTLTWSPDGGLPLVWDCMVGQGTIRWDLMMEEDLVQQVDLTLPALPFGRTPAPMSATLTAVQTELRGIRYALSGLKGSARSAVAAAIVWSSAVSAWLLHKPPSDADPNAPILTAVSGTTVTVSGAEKLRGTYTVALGIQTYNAPGQPRTMTVTVGQNGTTQQQVIRRRYISELNLRPLIVGNITLPLADRPPEASLTLDFTFADTGGGITGDTQVMALLLLDTRGQTVMSMAQPDGVGNTLRSWLDEPDVTAVVGQVWNATGSTRASAFAAAVPRISGGPIVLSEADEGGSLVLIGSEANPSSIAVSYSPRWLAERVE